MISKRHTSIFSMGAVLLLCLAATVPMAAHYWEMLFGVALIAIVGILYVDWVVWHAEWWAANENDDKRVKYTAIAVAFLLAVMMISNAAAVIAMKYEKRQREAWVAEKESVLAANTGAREGKTKTEAAVKDSAMRTQGEVEIAASQNRADAAQRMRESGISSAVVSRWIRAEEARDLTKTRSSRAPVSLAPPTEEKVAELPVPPEPPSFVPTAIKKYMGFPIFVAPFLLALLGKLAITVAIALPGGAEAGRPSSARRTGAGFAPAAAEARDKRPNE